MNLTFRKVKICIIFLARKFKWSILEFRKILLNGTIFGNVTQPLILYNYLLRKVSPHLLAKVLPKHSRLSRQAFPSTFDNLLIAHPWCNWDSRKTRVRSSPQQPWKQIVKFSTNLRFFRKRLHIVHKSHPKKSNKVWKSLKKSHFIILRAKRATCVWIFAPKSINHF